MLLKSPSGSGDGLSTSVERKVHCVIQRQKNKTLNSTFSITNRAVKRPLLVTPMLNVQHTTSHRNHTNVLKTMSDFVKTTQTCF